MKSVFLRIIRKINYLLNFLQFRLSDTLEKLGGSCSGLTETRCNSSSVVSSCNFNQVFHVKLLCQTLCSHLSSKTEGRLSHLPGNKKPLRTIFSLFCAGHSPGFRRLYEPSPRKQTFLTERNPSPLPARPLTLCPDPLTSSVRF